MFIWAMDALFVVNTLGGVFAEWRVRSVESREHGNAIGGGRDMVLAIEFETVGECTLAGRRSNFEVD